MVNNLSLRTFSLLAATLTAIVLSGCSKDDSSSSPDRGPGGSKGDEEVRRQCDDDADCRDDLFCNGKETCERGWCRAGNPVDCDDGLECTLDTCDEDARSCVSTAPDLDGDGAVDASCLDKNGSPMGTDCDDDDPLRYPGALEVCDGENRDEDCDPTSFGFTDHDQDGYISASCCNEQKDGGLLCGLDCDDFKVEVNPEATEVCDFFDNDCNGETDEGVSFKVYPDLDHDGRGDDKAKKIKSCPGAVGIATVAGDCDDSDPEVFTGQYEICDGKDNNCNGEADEIKEQAPWFLDSDEDSFGDPDSAAVYSCYRIKGRVLSYNDCDDGDASINRNATEICDAKDNDCNGLADFRVGTNDFEDDDSDGVADDACGGDDCNDSDPRTAGGAPEVCDRVDNDCDGEVDEQTVQDIWYVDEDGDGWGMVQGNALASCYPLFNRSTRYGDCDDQNAEIFPRATERCDGVDNDCDGQIDEQASVFCEGENAISFCQEGGCEVFTCLSGYAVDEENPAAGCQPTPLPETPIACQVDDDCNDKNVCNGTETCQDGACRPGSPINCGGESTLFGDAFIVTGPDLQALIGIETITGSLTVSSPFLSSLVGLEALATIGGDLIIRNNQFLKRLSGSALSELKTVGGNVVIDDNPALESVDLPSLSSAYSIQIENNEYLTHVSGYASLVSVGYQIKIRNNPLLTSISGFSSLQYLGGAHLQLDPVAGRCNSDTAGGLRVSENTSLQNIAAFEELSLIEGDLCIDGYGGAPLFFPSLEEVGSFGRLSTSSSVEFPSLRHWGRDFVYIGQASGDDDADSVSLEFPKLTSAAGWDLISELPIKKLSLGRLTQAGDVSIDLSAASAGFMNLDLDRLESATSLYLDLPGDELSELLVSKLRSSPSFVYVRAVGPQLSIIDLSRLVSTGSLQVYAYESTGPVELRLDDLDSVGGGQNDATLALCTGILVTDEPPTYQAPACSAAQVLLDGGFPGAIEEVTCGQCSSGVVTCSEECDDQNECTTDECVEGECVYFARPPASTCSMGYCSGGTNPGCVSCLDTEESPDTPDLGCGTGAPQCLLDGAVAVCAGCESNNQCDSPSECTSASCIEGFCQVSNLSDGTTCSGGVCDSGACVECIEGGNDCGNGYCDDGSCVQCLSDNHCSAGVCDNGTCVQCLANSHCDDQNACTRNSCVEKQCRFVSLPSGTQCTGGVCDEGSCVVCVDDSSSGVDAGCDATMSHCIDQNGPVCVECESNAECTTDNECETARCQRGTCQVQNAAQGTECTGGVCDAGSCKECIGHGDCSSGACDGGACVSCVDDQSGTTTVDTGCSVGAPQCLIGNQGPVCAGCANDSQCQAPGECSVASCESGFCEVADAAQGTSCDGGVCDAGSCVECIEGGDECGSLFCDDGACVQCLGPEHCDGGFCDVGSCVQCLLPSHCDDQNDCTSDQCSGGLCSNEPRAEGASCEGGVCAAADVPQCVQCLENTDCDDGIDCTTDRCRQNTCSHVPEDKACGDSDDVCRPFVCSQSVGCQQTNIGSWVSIINSDLLDGSFERGGTKEWSPQSEYQHTIFVGSARGSGGPTTPLPDNKIFAWLGGVANDSARIFTSFSIPSGATDIRLVMDTSFQTEDKQQSGDSLVIRLMEPTGAPAMTLGQYTAKDAQVETSDWTEKGVVLQQDITDYAGYQGMILMFESNLDGKARTDFIFDNIVLEARVCQ